MSKVPYYDINLLNSSTTGGRAWLEKYLHPPGVTPPDYAGYPDDSVNSTIRSEYRLVNTLNTVTTGLPSLGALFLITPGILNPIYQATLSSATTEPQYTSIVPNGEISPDAAVANFQATRNCYQSTTIKMNCTDFNNSGFFSIGQTAIIPYNLLPTAALFRKYKEYRAGNVSMERFAKFAHHLIEEKQKAKFTVDHLCKFFSCLDQIEHDESAFQKAIGAIPVISNIIQVARLGQTPRTPGDITDLSPKFAEIEAKEGCFIVAQKSQPNNDFKSTTAGYISSGADSGLMRCAYEYFNDANFGFLEWFQLQGGAPAQDLPWSNFTWCHVMITGMTPATSASSTPALHFKHLIGTESIALPRSILNTTVKRPALFDPEALASAAKVVQSRADGLLSIFNDIGDAGEALATEAKENDILSTVLATGGQTNVSLGGLTGRFAQMAAGIKKPVTAHSSKPQLAAAMRKLSLKGRPTKPPRKIQPPRTGGRRKIKIKGPKRLVQVSTWGGKRRRNSVKGRSFSRKNSVSVKVR